MLAMRTLTCSIAIALALALPACGKKTESGSEAGAGSASTTYDCKIFIKKKVAPPVEGHATDADEAKATEAAWKDACSKLAAPDQPDCRNKDKWSPAISNGSMTFNGKKSSTVTIKLEQNADQITGKGKSAKSEDDACRQATEDACKKAGASGDCVAAGGFEQQGRSTESTRGSL